MLILEVFEKNIIKMILEEFKSKEVIYNV